MQILEILVPMITIVVVLKILQTVLHSNGNLKTADKESLGPELTKLLLARSEDQNQNKQKKRLRRRTTNNKKK